ncbi:hypothetical protein IV203_030920 [Nitzschia inconspicua]|uniref:Uncharacterized protein n=1 Tax=Nitzschia inconspicua TaxID=303405 RepID=A0A9K3LTZ7_9STRA|nr:hypothetical protein IV203_030920 [Nitzschia inconspicua]
MNIPDDPDKHQIPEKAKGNPVYEQTRQDMPLWCCGRNCGRNSRIVVFVLGVLGIACSVVVCFSVDYFSFVSLRNDTFTDPTKQKQQPHPFEHATEANVGIFRYEILDVYEYPWPPKQQERKLFDELHNRELRRLAVAEQQVNEVVDNESDLRILFDRMRKLQNDTGDEEVPVDDIEDSADTTGGSNETQPEFTKPPDVELTAVPTAPQPVLPPSEIPNIGPGSTKGSDIPTEAPTSAPTITNPNDLIEAEIGVIKPYPEGIGQFDQMFTNAQRGAMLAPIFATLGLFFSCIEVCCCTYKCSWLPTAIFLYGAFMFQLMTMFLFMSEDFCKYDQDCALGLAGFLSVIAVLAYFICQNLICCTPRPQPIFNFCKKKTPRRKKKKKKKNANNDEDRGLAGDDEGFQDEPNGYVDPYDENYDQPESYYEDDEGYDPSYVDDGYDDGESAYAEGNGDSSYGESMYTDGDAQGDGYGDYNEDNYASQR